MQNTGTFMKTDLTIKRPTSSDNICPMTNDNTKIILVLQYHWLPLKLSHKPILLLKEYKHKNWRVWITIIIGVDIV